MSKSRKRLSSAEAELLGLEVKPKTEGKNIHPKYRISQSQWAEVLQFRGALKEDDASVNDTNNETVTNQYGELAYANDNRDSEAVKLSAYVDGKMLNIEE